jgi:hypothetical protein
MARVAIFVMLPIVALLVWRDVVLERQLQLLAVYDAAHHDDYLVSLQISQRNETIDEAMWALLRDDPARALERIDEAGRMPAATLMPDRAGRIAELASCLLGDAHPYWHEPDPRVIQICAARRLNKHAAAAVQK